MSGEIKYVSTEELVRQNQEIINAIEAVPQQLDHLRQQLAWNRGVLSERERLESQDAAKAVDTTA